jgi:hypothetical protein
MNILETRTQVEIWRASPLGRKAERRRDTNGTGFEVRTAVPAYIRYLRSGLRTARNDALRIEQTRLARENADAQALENARTRGTLVEAESVYRFYVGVFVSMRQKILGSDLSDCEKADILADLRRAAQRKKGERLYA